MYMCNIIYDATSSHADADGDRLVQRFCFYYILQLSDDVFEPSVHYTTLHYILVVSLLFLCLMIPFLYILIFI